MGGEYDGIGEQDKKMPIGMVFFFLGIIAWGIYYIASFTPAISGWSQKAVYEEAIVKMQAEAKPVLKENPYETDAKAIEEGKGLYATNCAACHGENLEGGVGPSLTAHLKYGETDDKMFASTAKGTPNGMPPFENQLGTDRIWKILAYVDSIREK